MWGGFRILTDYQSHMTRAHYGKDIDLSSPTYVEQTEGSQKVHCPMDRYCVTATLDQCNVWPGHRYISTDGARSLMTSGLSIPLKPVCLSLCVFPDIRVALPFGGSTFVFSFYDISVCFPTMLRIVFAFFPSSSMSSVNRQCFVIF